MKFKTELHCHTEDVSPCSHESAGAVVEKYVNAGYTSLVITNHATDYIFNNFIPEGTWREKTDYYFDAIDKVRRAACDRLNVIDGMEIGFTENGNDYLVFGITRELFYGCEDVFKMGHRAFHGFARDNSLLFIQAHPMRFGITTVSPDNVDGYEIFNGHPDQRSHNGIAEAWARHFTRHKLILTSGTDNHEPYMIPDGGIITSAPIATAAELISVLRSGEYEIIRSPLGDAEY